MGPGEQMSMGGMQGMAMKQQGGEMKDMPGMDMKAMQGTKMGGGKNPNAASDQAVPAAALSAGMEATSPDGPLANTGLDASMDGMMAEQMGGRPRLSDEQRRNLNAFDMGKQSMQQQMTESSPQANNVPNFPQDVYMEGPMMNMDKLVEKPENLGLRPNWSRFMQGMMTFVRVLPPEQYDQVVAGMRQANRRGDPYASLYVASSDRPHG